MKRKTCTFLLFLLLFMSSMIAPIRLVHAIWFIHPKLELTLVGPSSTSLIKSGNYTFVIWLINQHSFFQSEDGQNPRIEVQLSSGRIVEAVSEFFEFSVIDSDTKATFQSTDVFKEGTARVAVIKAETSEDDFLLIEVIGSTEDRDTGWPDNNQLSIASSQRQYTLFSLSDGFLPLDMSNLATSRITVAQNYVKMYRDFISFGNPYMELDRVSLSDSIVQSTKQASDLLELCEILYLSITNPAEAILQFTWSGTTKVLGIGGLTDLLDFSQLLLERLNRILEYHYPLFLGTDRTLARINVPFYPELYPGYLDEYIDLVEEEKSNWETENYGQIYSSLLKQNDMLEDGLLYIRIILNKANYNDDLLANCTFKALEGYLEQEIEIVSQLKVIVEDQTADPDFCISSNPSIVHVLAGESSECMIRVNPVGDFDEVVALSFNVDPANEDILGTFTPQSIAPGEESTFQISTGSLVTGEYDVSISGLFNQTVRTIGLKLYVDLLDITIHSPEPGTEITGIVMINASLNVRDPEIEGALRDMHYSVNDGDWFEMTTMGNEGSVYFDSSHYFTGLIKISVEACTTTDLCWKKSINVRANNPYIPPETVSISSNEVSILICEIEQKISSQNVKESIITAQQNVESNQVNGYILQQYELLQTQIVHTSILEDQNVGDSNPYSLNIMPIDNPINSNTFDFSSIPETLQIDTNQIQLHELPDSVFMQSSSAEILLESTPYLVVRGLNNRIYYRVYNSSSSSWEEWRVVHSGTTCDRPGATVLDHDLHIVVRGMSGNLYHGWIDLDTDVFSGWTWIDGSTLSTPTLVDDESSLYLVVRGNNDRVYYREWNGSWGEWTSLPGRTMEAPGATVVGDDLHLVVVGMSGGLYHGAIDLTTHGFSGWLGISGSTPSMPVLTDDESSVYLTVRGGSNIVYYREWNGSWGEWTSLPGRTANSPGVCVVGDDLHLSVRGMTGGIYHSSVDLTTHGFSGWALLSGATPSSPTLTA